MNKLVTLAVTIIVAVLFVWAFTREAPQADDGSGISATPKAYPSFAGIDLGDEGGEEMPTANPLGMYASPKPKHNELENFDFQEKLSSKTPVECDMTLNLGGGETETAKSFFQDGKYRLEFTQEIGNESYYSVYVWRDNALYYKFIDFPMRLGDEECDWMVLKDWTGGSAGSSSGSAQSGSNEIQPFLPDLGQDLPANRVDCKPGSFTAEKFRVPNQGDACDVAEFVKKASAFVSPLPSDVLQPSVEPPE